MSAGLPNTGGGVLVQGAQQTTISGSTISGNTGFGVRLSATKTVTITGNVIGLGTDRMADVGNTGPGIDVQDGSTNTLIGGSAANANYLAYNDAGAITIAGSTTVSTTVSSNIIGLALSGTSYTAPAGNTGDGVLVQGGARSTTVSNNTIGSNSGAGVKIAGSDTMTATLSANIIGWLQSGNSPLLERPNALGGIMIDQASYITATGNLLAHNVGNGITASSVQTATLQSNQIFFHTTGSAIEVNGASRNVQVLGNSVQQNRDYGVFVRDTSQGVRIQSNKMTENALGGVKLEGTTRSAGSGPDDALTLPNHGIDPPIVDPTFANPLSLRIDQNGMFEGWVYTDTATLPASACSPANTCQIQFFQPDPNIAKTPAGQGFQAYMVLPDSGSTAVDFATPQADGRFSGQLDLKGALLPRQLIFAATDANGNTSEFGTLDLGPSISLSYLSTGDGMQNAVPGQTVTYTLSLTNTGSVDLTNARFVTSGSLDRWLVTPPNNTTNTFDLPAQQSRVLTVTMTLPSGTDPNVRAGVQDRTTVTISALGSIATLSKSRIVTTTVQASPVVVASTLDGSGSAPPNGKVPHVHQFMNTGNVTVTLNLAGKSLDPAGSSLWDPVLSASSLQILPGETKTVTATITVPPGAQAFDALGLPFTVTTLVTATAEAPFASIVKTVSGVTGVDLVKRAQMTVNGLPIPAASFAEITFNHNIFNQSNGKARFCLNYRSTSGSSVLSYTSQNGIVISGNCFTLDAPVNNSPTSLLRLQVLVKVTGKLLPGSLDSLTIYLTDPVTGEEIPNASATDVVEITVSPLLPAIWLPVVVR